MSNLALVHGIARLPAMKRILLVAIALVACAALLALLFGSGKSALPLWVIC